MLTLRFLLKSDPHKRLSRQLDLNLASRLRRALGILLALTLLHVLAMMVLESMTVGDAVWLTLTTLTTVGYGDLSAATPAGRMATVGLLYFAGITLLAQLASDYIDFRLERKDRMIKGQWRWKMSDHIVIINSPRANAETYFRRLISQVRESRAYRHCTVQLLTMAFPDGLPDSLRELGVIHRHGHPDDNDSLHAVDVDKASAVIILARDEYDRSSDSLTLDILHRVRELLSDSRPRIIAESVMDQNRNRFLVHGADTTLRPVRSYPEMLVQALVAPGAEKILENLFTHHDDHTVRFPVTLSGRSWSDIVCTMINANLGTALAYVTEDDHVVCHPPADHEVHARGLIVMVREGEAPSTEQVQTTLDGA